MTIDAWGIAVAMGIPTAMTGFLFWLLKKHIDKKDTMREGKEEARKEFEVQLLRGVNASLALGEATARAVQRIPDAHCNGDMHNALDYATKIKHEQKEFLTRQGVENLFRGE